MVFEYAIAVNGYQDLSFLTSWGTPLSMSEIHIYVPGNSEKEL